MKLLVTGANGFVGQALFADAENDGHEYVAVTRRPGTGPRGFQELNIDDINSKTEWSEALSGVDVVVHLAARVHQTNETSKNALGLYLETNTAGTLRLAQVAAASGVARFVFVSSIKVNGESTSGTPFSATSVESPQDPYGLSKFRAEVGLRQLAESTRMQIVVLRPSVVYGPGVSGNISRIVGLILRGLPLPLASVRNQRSMLSIRNLTVAIRRAVEMPREPRGPILLSDTYPVSTPELVRALASGLGVKTRLFAAPMWLLRLGGLLVGRQQEIARLTEDLVVEPSWGDLGIDTAALDEPLAKFHEVGQWFAAQRDV